MQSLLTVEKFSTCKLSTWIGREEGKKKEEEEEDVNGVKRD